ncbi:unnamed protein product [Caenorhabditis auriculariae]|uniref:Reverse transcriptase domain-containing protein n=1 Tax=Caenorhabditis auriculariae TaxID=2777116 RepID=A0A8S1GZP6_9PELO|nr:unnamed protein product [Caenorhabditis auriculariae]
MNRLLTLHKDILERWRRHFAKIANEEFAHPDIPWNAPVLGPTPKIEDQEVVSAIKSMKPSKATGPDDMAAEIWKKDDSVTSKWLADLFNQVIKENKMPQDWNHSTTVPIWKKKGSPADCSCVCIYVCSF